MVGDERARFCASCKLNVYNVEVLTKDELEALIREKEGETLCVRMFVRKDGTALTRDCPVGFWRSVILWAAALVGLTLLAVWLLERNRPPPFVGTRF